MKDTIIKYDYNRLGEFIAYTCFSIRKIARILNCSINKIKPIVKRYNLDNRKEGYVKKIDIGIIRHNLYERNI